MKAISELEKFEGAWKAFNTAGIYLLVVGGALILAHFSLSCAGEECLVWIIFLSTTALIAFLVQHDFTRILEVRTVAELEHRRTEKVLRESEERFRSTFDQATVGIAHVSLDGRWLRINPKYCDILGYSAGELKTLNIEDITHPDDRELTKKHMELLKEGRIGDYCLEKRYIRKDGTTVWVNLTVSKVAEPDGTPRFFIGVVEDITERKLAEEAMRFSEARYRALFHDNPTMIFTLDVGWRILSANPMCTSQLGYRLDEIEGRSALEFFHVDDRPAVAEQLRNCLRNPGRVYRWQFRKVRKDGDLLWVEETAEAVYDLKGEPNVLVVCQDITARRRAQEEIERLNAALAARAAELEDSNLELEAFNYAVAHDLRKPLTTVNGYCQILREDCADILDERCLAYLQEAYEATCRMNQLIDTLLNFARLTGVELHQGEVDLSALAQATIEELRLADPARRVVIKIAPEISATGDAGLLRVVMENLLGNAWKYTGRQEEAVIEFGRTERGGNPTYFVRDNGQGFDMANVGNLFMPFQRLPGSEEFRGHGIGLATVERIIRRHGGRIWAEGEPGKGATFYFTLTPD
ncbi:MAG: PAS domain S-box protein [Desulfuromonadales bacterium]